MKWERKSFGTVEVPYDITVKVRGEKYVVSVGLMIIQDPSYGADADGNRGMTMYEIDDFEIINIQDQEQNEIPEDEEIIEAVSSALEALDLDTVGNLYYQGKEGE